MFTKELYAIMLIIVVLFTQVGCRPQGAPNAQAQPMRPGMGGPGMTQEKTVSVMVYQVQPETISRYVKLTGGLEAGDETLVYSETTAKLEQIKVKVGEQVKANQVLAIQSSRVLQQGVNQAKVAVENALAQEELARQNHERNEQLLQKQIISQQQFDQTEAALKSAQLTVEQARAQLGQSQEQQGSSVIKAPFAGKVAQILFNKGDMVASGKAVFKIVNTGTFKAKLDVPETEAANVSLGQTVLATFPAIPDTEFTGVITRIDEAIDPAKRALEIEVSFGVPNSETGGESDHQTLPAQKENPQSAKPAGDFAKLKSGLFGQFKIEIQRHENAVVIPDNVMKTQTAVKVNERGEQTTLKTYYVYVAEQGKAVMKTVTPGIYASGRVELTSGVNMGEAVIVVGQNTVKDGAAVAIANQQARVE